MPKFEIELDDKGEFLGQLPTEFDAVLQKLRSVSHGEGYGKGSQKAAEEAKKQIDDAVRVEKMKLEASMPLERMKWQEIDDLNKSLKTQLETTMQESRKNLTAREEAHAVELTKRMDSEKKRNEKIRGLVNANLRALSAQAGARDESLGELEVILQHRIGYDDDMEPFVRAEDGSPAKTAAGNPLPLDVFVKQYLENHPHHRRPASGRGGDARRGASLSGTPAPASMAAAKERYEQDRSPEAINELFLAGRKAAS